MASYATVAQLRDYLPQVADLGQQQIALTGAPSGGTFTLSYEGTATVAIASNATATTVQTALRAISAIGSSGVVVTGRPGGPWLAKFQGALTTDAGPLSLGTNSLTGGTNPSVSIESATEDLLQDCLDRATSIVREAMRARLADPNFDYTAYGVASTKIVRGHASEYLTLPAHQSGSVALVEYQQGTNPATYATIADQYLQENGQLYRAIGWDGGFYGARPRYRITAVWGYGPTPPDAIVELTLELAVNIWRSRDKGGFTEMVGVEGNGAIRMVAGLNKQQEMILDNVCNQLYQVAV